LIQRRSTLHDDGEGQKLRNNIGKDYSQLEGSHIQGQYEYKFTNPTSSPLQRNRIFCDREKKQLARPKTEGNYSRSDSPLTQEYYESKSISLSAQHKFHQGKQGKSRTEKCTHREDHHKKKQSEYLPSNFEDFNERNAFDYQKQDINKRKSITVSNVPNHSHRRERTQNSSGQDIIFRLNNKDCERSRCSSYHEDNIHWHQEIIHDEASSYFSKDEKRYGRKSQTEKLAIDLMPGKRCVGGTDRDITGNQTQPFYRKCQNERLTDAQSQSYHDSIYRRHHPCDRTSGRNSDKYSEVQRRKKYSPRSFHENCYSTVGRHAYEKCERRHKRNDEIERSHPLLGRRFIPKQK